MQELISPAQSEILVGAIAGLFLLFGAVLGWKSIGVRGLSFGLSGPLVFGMWQFHKWVTRYDPQTEYFGLDKVWVLLLEVVLFVALGAVLGVLTRKLISRRSAE